MTEAITLDEIGERWGKLLTQSFAQIISLEKRMANLQADNVALSAEVDRLRSELHKVQAELGSLRGPLSDEAMVIAADGNAIINRAKEKAAD